MTNKNSYPGSLPDLFALAMADIFARVNLHEPADSTAIAIAYSGGLDSSVLLHLAHAFALKQGVALHAFHIHHGLSPNADRWGEHCRQTCQSLGVHFDLRRVELAGKDGGIEEAARMARYAALGALCTAHGVPLVLTAHHVDDQAETVLLQLLRGSGISGLSGMETANCAPSLLGSAAVTIARPLLSVSRVQLEEYAQIAHIAHVDDESNLDTRYARNALRHRVMPAIAACFPGFQQRFARTAQHAQAGQRLLVELAAQDLARCQANGTLDVNHIRQLDADRANNMLRYWFGLHGLRMPSTAWLDEMRSQLLDAKADAQVCVTHADCHIRRHRDRVFITPRTAHVAKDLAEDAATGPQPQAFTWHGEASLHFSAYRGTLYFDTEETGLDAGWLRGQACVIHFRQGGERLKLAPNRPTRALKYHYQAMNIPAWQRLTLPLVSSAEQLLFAAGIGMDCAHVGTGTVERIRLRWLAELA